MDAQDRPPPSLLNLPAEMRLEIYTYALLDSPHITIGTSKICGNDSDIVHRLYGEDRAPYPGIPLHHEPAIRAYYDASLLGSSTSKPHRTSATTTLSGNSNTYTSRTALLATNHQIRDELSYHLALATKNLTKPKTQIETPATGGCTRNVTRMNSNSANLINTSKIFLSYPHGLHLFRTHVPHLLHQTRSIHIAGTYIPRTFNMTYGAEIPVSTVTTTTTPTSDPSNPKPAPTEADPQFYNAQTLPDPAANLQHLIALLYGPSPSPSLAGVEKLELRILFPGSNSYSTVWGDDNSPIPILLRNVASGHVKLQIERGDGGTGVCVRVTRGEGGRVVESGWGKVPGFLGGEGGWVVDGVWPEG